MIDLQTRQATVSAAHDRVGELLKRVRGIVLSRLEVLARTLFDNVDDALFDRAEKAESNSVQAQFFDGMREVRKSRQRVERRFQELLSALFTDFASGRINAATSEMAVPTTSGLSLVEDRDLEEALAISGVVAKVESRLARPLFQVNRRLSVISGGSEIENALSPIGPAQLGQAFRESLAELDTVVEIKLIIYKLFDRYVMTALEPLYEEINTELIHAGVLPQLKDATPHATSRPPSQAGRDEEFGDHAGNHAHETEEAFAQANDRSQPVDSGNSRLQQEIYDTLRSLLASRHSGPSSENAAIGAPRGEGRQAHSPTPSPTELLNALTILQTQWQPSGPALPMQANESALLMQRIKQDLLDQVSRFGDAQRPRSVSSADEDTIDLVGMLFEYILQDHNLPAEFQAILGRLQIPYLKVAILDKHLFAQRSHPARRLLDTLAKAGLSWSADGDPEQRLLERARTVVDTILRDFDDDITIFERERADFDHFVNQHRKRADLTEQRAAEATRGREKLQYARRRSADEILTRIGDRELPPVIHEVLSRPWSNLLVMTLLRHGDDSPEWTNALRFADELVWSAQPKQSATDHDRLQKLLPQLDRALRQGLYSIAYHDDDIHQILDRLATFYRFQQQGDPIELTTVQKLIAAHVEVAAVADSDNLGPIPTVSPAGSASADAGRSPVEEIVLGTVQPGSVTDTPTESMASDDEAIQRVKALGPGTWVEFIDVSGEHERAKLSWISPITSKYLFVNRRGLKVREIGLQALAIELRDGQALVLEQAPLFDRAMDAVVKRLRGNDGAELGTISV
ncbi:MAG: DUF1631 domain-containing protein [Dokdonella sp.]